MAGDHSKYADCMEEIKKRTEVVNGFLTRQCHAIFVQSTVESIALQIRKILELIALASMVANKAEYARHRKNFQKDWSAKRILDTLEEANPNYYPVPNRQIVDEGTGEVRSLENLKSGFLTKQNFATLLDKCDRLLHADNPFSVKQNPSSFLESVPAWMEKIRRLLNHHTIQLIDEDQQLWVLMEAKSDGKVYVYEFQLYSDGNALTLAPAWGWGQAAIFCMAASLASGLVGSPFLKACSGVRPFMLRPWWGRFSLYWTR